MSFDTIRAVMRRRDFWRHAFVAVFALAALAIAPQAAEWIAAVTIAVMTGLPLARRRRAPRAGDLDDGKGGA